MSHFGRRPSVGYLHGGGTVGADRLAALPREAVETMTHYGQKSVYKVTYTETRKIRSRDGELTHVSNEVRCYAADDLASVERKVGSIHPDTRVKIESIVCLGEYWGELGTCEDQ